MAFDFIYSKQTHLSFLLSSDVKRPVFTLIFVALINHIKFKNWNSGTFSLQIIENDFFILFFFVVRSLINSAFIWLDTGCRTLFPLNRYVCAVAMTVRVRMRMRALSVCQHDSDEESKETGAHRDSRQFVLDRLNREHNSSAASKRQTKKLNSIIQQNGRFRRCWCLFLGQFQSRHWAKWKSNQFVGGEEEVQRIHSHVQRRQFPLQIQVCSMRTVHFLPI